MLEPHINSLRLVFKYFVPIYIVISLLKVTMYYHQFDIDISQYLVLSDVISAFLTDAVFHCVLLILTIVVSNFPYREGDIYVVKTPLAFFKLGIFNIVAAIFVAIAFNEILKLFDWLYIALIAFGRPILFQFYDKQPDAYIIDDERDLNSKWYKPYYPNLNRINVVYFFVALLSFEMLSAKSDHLDAVNGKYHGSKFEFSDRTIVATDSLAYIGKSNEYLFFVDKRNIQPVVASTDGLKQIVLKKKPKLIKLFTITINKKRV